MEILLILWLSCGVINYFVTKSKGYPNNICRVNGVCGFLFGFVGLVVALCKKDYDSSDDQKRRESSALEELGQLSKKKETGEISEEEFELKKEELLKQI